MNRRIFKRLVSMILLPTLILSLMLAAPPLSWAAEALGNQAINQPATLVAPEPDAKIAIYLRPEAGKSKAGYGANGDAVTVLEQVSDNQSLTWNHIRFDNSPYAEGWVQETFLTSQAAVVGTQGQNQQPMASDRYLGDRRSQSNQRSQQANQQNSAQSYSQRNQN